MQTRRLGNSALDITPLGFGAWAIGGSGWEYAWGAQDDEQSVRAIHRALRKRNADFQEPALSRHLALVERLRAVGARHGRTPGQAAIGWTRRNPAVTGAIVGARSAEQVDGVFGGGALALTDEDVATVER